MLDSILNRIASRSPEEIAAAQREYDRQEAEKKRKAMEAEAAAADEARLKSLADREAASRAAREKIDAARMAVLQEGTRGQAGLAEALPVLRDVIERAEREDWRSMLRNVESLLARFGPAGFGAGWSIEDLCGCQTFGGRFERSGILVVAPAGTEEIVFSATTARITFRNPRTNLIETLDIPRPRSPDTRAIWLFSADVAIGPQPKKEFIALKDVGHVKVGAGQDWLQLVLLDGRPITIAGDEFQQLKNLINNGMPNGG